MSCTNHITLSCFLPGVVLCPSLELSKEFNRDIGLAVCLSCINSLLSSWSAIGGGQKNWAYTGAEMVSINGGMHNICTGDWTAIGGGVKNKAYSNYATVIGGYLNKASSKFATVLGGSRNTCSGRYSSVMGFKTKVTSDYSIGLGFSGADCFIRGANTFGVCANKFVLSGSYGDFDLLAELGSRRQLGEVTKQVDEVEAENAALESKIRSRIQELLESDRLTAETATTVGKLLNSLA